MLRQPEVKKGIVPYKLAKKRAEGAYVLPDGTVVDSVTDEIQVSLTESFFDDEDRQKNLLAIISSCLI